MCGCSRTEDIHLVEKEADVDGHHRFRTHYTASEMSMLVVRSACRLKAWLEMRSLTCHFGAPSLTHFRNRSRLNPAKFWSFVRNYLSHSYLHRHIQRHLAESPRNVVVVVQSSEQPIAKATIILELINSFL